MTTIQFEWKCPKCGAPHDDHGKGECHDHFATESHCVGFVCECEVDTEEHGQSLSDPCRAATCYHCGWKGTFPKAPKSLQVWERQALKAGWSPPESRRKELGLSETRGAIVSQPVGQCDGSKKYAYDPSNERGRGKRLSKPCSGCRACS